MSCTTILVGRLASNDGSTIIGRTDDGMFDVKKLVAANQEICEMAKRKTGEVLAKVLDAASRRMKNGCNRADN